MIPGFPNAEQRLIFYAPLVERPLRFKGVLKVQRAAQKKRNIKRHRKQQKNARK